MEKATVTVKIYNRIVTMTLDEETANEFLLANSNNLIKVQGKLNAEVLYQENIKLKAELDELKSRTIKVSIVDRELSDKEKSEFANKLSGF